MEGELLFRLLTPQKEVASVRCESVNLIEKEDLQGLGGGSIGVRRGHIPAVIALAEDGAIKVISGGKAVFRAAVHGGFARVDAASVTVLTPAAEIFMDAGN